MTFAICTLGCKVNQYESEAIAEMFINNGHKEVDFNSVADVYIINTCSVTNVSDKKSKKMIRRAHCMNENAFVAVCGCYAQTSAEEVAAIEGVNLIVGTKDRNKIVEKAESFNRATPEILVEDISNNNEYETLELNSMKNRTRAYIKIQDGCRQYCSYCIIPYARGPIRSRPIEQILHEADALAKSGYKEIVLTGIHVASYGKDLIYNESLIDVIKKISDNTSIERIRTSSIEPKFITQQFLANVAETKKVCDHFHISLQSGSQRILKLMNRKYTPSDFLDSVKQIKQIYPRVALWTDVIVGFPTETDDDFLETYEFIKKSGLVKLHVFPYSPKKGTPAAEMSGQIDVKIKNARAHELTKLSTEIYNNYMEAFLESEVEVLFEKEVAPKIYEGHTTNYIKVLAESSVDVTNSILSVRLMNIENDCIRGVVL